MNESKPARQPEYLGVGGLLWEMAKVFLLAVVIIIPVRVFLFQPFFVQGSSMEPNFVDGEYLVISEFGYKETRLGSGVKSKILLDNFRDLERQEAIVFKYPKNASQYFIKRIIALPGEKIAIKNGRVVITNEEHPEGFVLDESNYLKTVPAMQEMEEYTLEEDEYFVMGDNRMFSYDSRGFGPVKERFVIGRVLLRAWPLERSALY